MSTSPQGDSTFIQGSRGVMGASMYSGWGNAGQIAWDMAMRELEHLASLKHGWDGEDADPIEALILESTEQLLQELQRRYWGAPTRIVPTPEGGLAVEWRSATRYQEIEIEEPYCGDVMDAKDGGSPEHYRFCWRELSQRSGLASWPDVMGYPVYEHSPIRGRSSAY